MRRRWLTSALGNNSFLLHQDDLRAGIINPLKHGVMYADAITTVSPTHAKEIQTDEYGMGLQGYLRDRANVVTGILNGVDYDEWDPRHDRQIAHHYDPEHMEGKVGAEAGDHRPLQTESGSHDAALRHREPHGLAERSRPSVRVAARAARVA